MLRKGYDRNGSVEKKKSVFVILKAWRQDELIGSKPPVVK
jgi:hypothetical protein